MAAQVTLSKVSALESKTVITTDEHTADSPQLELGENADGLLLHLIRTIALYLFVFLSHTAVTDVELAVFFSDAATLDLLDEQTKEVQPRLHAALFTWVQSEVNSNQFDGLVQEQRAFVVIKRLFRHQRTKTTAQCRVLARLLSCYLTRLETPLVYCEPSSMLSSTLEYLVAKEKNGNNKEPVPLPMLYPLVNAVDLVSIEQRECLDALMNLLGWVSAHDQSQKVFTTFTSNYHMKIIGMAEDSDNNNNNISRRTGNVNTSDELGVCFVQMLLRYSDHIFRRDLQFEDVVPTLSYSDTEDDDVFSEDNGTRSRRQSSHDLNDIKDNLSAQDFEKSTPAEMSANGYEPTVPTTLSEHKQDDKKQEFVELKKNIDVAALPAEVSSRSLRKRKKREEKAMAVPVKTIPRTRCRSKPTREAEFEDELLISKEWADEEPLAAVVCVGIAAAAGTLAAMLCVFFN